MNNNIKKNTFSFQIITIIIDAQKEHNIHYKEK